MACKVGPYAEMPRISLRQQHRSNAEAQTPTNWRVFWTERCHSFTWSFLPSMAVATSLCGLVPSVLCARDFDLTALWAAITKYSGDLPSSGLRPRMELQQWEAQYPSMEPELRPASPTLVMECDTSLYFNISLLLKIVCTLPVTPCECNRSASALCCFKH